MAVYPIIRIYKVPVGSRQQARDWLMESIVLQEERGFHVIDIVREPGAKPGHGKRVNLKPPN
jgi:hypothetical protein